MSKIGVDVGGTFTDLILEKENSEAEKNKVFVHKVPSTPKDQSIGVIRGVIEICEMAGIDLNEVKTIVHGTTIATNAIIEYDGAEVGMLTTKGFRDILHMARHKRPHNFSMQFDVPWQSKPLVKRRNRIPITERILPPDGKIETELNEQDVREAAKLLKKQEVEAVIICFIFSFLNNKHEIRAKEILKEIIPDIYISCSYEVADVIREYERFSTAAMNAFVGPRTSFYLRNLENSLRSKGANAEIRVMQSNGGVTTIEGGSQKPVTILMSGPAGGVIGGKWAGDLSGVKNLITVDIGGTSADISVVPNGNVRIMNPRDTKVAGYPILAPMIDLATIGAGGGSIAYVDEGGAFRVGPRSAGAEPGPACYGKGGTEPTVTDAQVVLGRLDPNHFLAGGIEIKPELAINAIENNLCSKLNLSVKEAALGIIRVINSNMSLEIRANSVAQGIDPRQYSLVAFGGAGPLHGVDLAKSVSAKEIIIPPAPGINAATGLLATDMQYEFTRSVLITISESEQSDLDKLNAELNDLMNIAQKALEVDGVKSIGQKFTRIAECRYQGQGFELRAEFPDGPITLNNKDILIKNFHDSHMRDYDHAFEEQNVEIITLRVIALATTEKLNWSKLEIGDGKNPKDAIMYESPTTFEDGTVLDTPRYDRNKLKFGQTISGAAIITQQDSTTFIPPDYIATISEYGNLIIRES
ncbi:MAG: methylhydantoinase [Rhodospirillaceae bacterium]|nr:methylhydantoinase [Rhodospirillaceae bacterium]